MHNQHTSILQDNKCNVLTIVIINRLEQDMNLCFPDTISYKFFIIKY